jgi:hypothetical protein
MVSWGADLPEAIVSLALLILVSGILLGDRIAAGAAVAATAAILGLTAAQISGHFAPDVTWRSEPIAFDHVPTKGILFAAIAAVAWLSNREMERSLQRFEFPVRWSANFGFGYGMPLFNFYAPLPYYLGQPLLFINTFLSDFNFNFFFTDFFDFTGFTRSSISIPNISESSAS